MNCKIIATCFINRSDQYFKKELTNQNGINTLLEKIIDLEDTIDKGVECDTIIVNNNVNYKEGNEFLNSLNNRKTKNGNIIIEHRENIGRSFGAYNHAFQKYKDKYEYWYFTEDKFVGKKDGYIKKFIDKFNEDKKTAFVSALGIGRKDKNPHAHGGCGLTNRKFLLEMLDYDKDFLDMTNQLIPMEYGILPHFKGVSASDQANTRPHCIYGEVPFTYGYVLMGYNVIPLMPDAKGPVKINEWITTYDSII